MARAVAARMAGWLVVVDGLVVVAVRMAGLASRAKGVVAERVWVTAAEMRAASETVAAMEGLWLVAAWVMAMAAWAKVVAVAVAMAGCGRSGPPVPAWIAERRVAALAVDSRRPSCR